MRIAVIAGYAPSLLNFRGPLLAELAGLGHEVFALAPPDEPDVPERLAGLGATFLPIRLNRRGMNPADDWATLRSVRARLRELRPELVLAYTIKPVIWGSLAARLERVPRVYSLVTGLGSALVGTTWRTRLVFGLVQGLYRAALWGNRAVFFQNPDDEAFFRSRRLVRPGTPTVVTPGSGVDLDHFAPAPFPEGQPPVFLMVARLLEQKGVRVFAEAARLVREELPGARFHLVGPREEGPGGIAEAELARWREEGLVQWFGYTGDVRPRLAECSAFVLPSHYGEGLPRTSAEAAATGRAVITTDHPGCREALIPGETGLTVPVRDPQALAKAMLRLGREPQLAGAMGRAGRRLAEERFDVRKVNRALLEAMELC
ncbi:MAG: glycosyltransferase family 4 protein [Desulfovibrionaceae bacterium]